MSFLNAGVLVTLVDISQAALDRGVATLCGNYEATVAKGSLSQTNDEARMASRVPFDFGRLADSNLVIEAVYEGLVLQQEIFGNLVRTDVVLASNAAYAATLSRHGQVWPQAIRHL